jgi:hypothetical protein
MRSLAFVLLVAACSRAPTSEPERAPEPSEPVATKPEPAPKVEAVATPVEERWLEDLLAADPANRELLADPARYRLQVLVTIVGPDAKTIEHGYRVDAEYTYPASAIKTFASVAALRELERLQAEGHAVELDTPIMFCALGRDRCREGPRTLAHEIHQMQLVSDNRAFNRLYDFVGHRAMNELAWAMGFDSVRIRHRMYDVDHAAVRRTTVKLELRPKHGAPVICAQRTSDLELPAPRVTAGLQIGEARLVKGKRVDGAMDFTDKNAVTLRDLHRLCLALARPDLPGVPQLGISAAHREVLLAAMTERAPEARFKPMLKGVARVVPSERVRYVSKAGRAFGFHLDNAYIEDRESGRAMAVTAVLYVDADGVLDDDRYEYDTVSFPFFARLGEALAKAVLVP